MWNVELCIESCVETGKSVQHQRHGNQNINGIHLQASRCFKMNHITKYFDIFREAKIKISDDILDDVFAEEQLSK